jgi:hypothetical protein
MKCAAGYSFITSETEFGAAIQLQGFLLRHGRIYPGESYWTKMHVEWIRRLKFDPIRMAIPSVESFV